MKFRITSVADESCGAKINDVTIKLEDWLNTALPDANFGTTLDQFMFVVVAVDDDPERNGRFADPWNKLSSAINPITNRKVKSLCVSVEVQPSKAAKSNHIDLLSHIAKALQQKLTIRPKRLPSGFDFPNASHAVSVALDAFA